MLSHLVAAGTGIPGIIGNSLTIVLTVAIMEPYGRTLKVFLKKSTPAINVAVTSADVAEKKNIPGVEFI